MYNINCRSLKYSAFNSYENLEKYSCIVLHLYLVTRDQCDQIGQFFKVSGDISFH